MGLERGSMLANPRFILHAGVFVSVEIVREYIGGCVMFLFCP